jgi:rhamnose transport system ATP-binding protein
LLLKLEGVNKSYAGVHALKSASFELRPGEVHALIGENGAGKSTLIKIITGAVAADDGEMALNGEPVNFVTPREAKLLGISAIYQQPTLFPELTVAENIAFGHEKFSLFGAVNWKRRQERAKELLGQVGARIDPDAYAGDLSMPQQQLVEIARALGEDAKILILDEPTASLSEEDAQNLFRLIRELRAKGVGMIYISHRLEELPAIADRVTVLRDGNIIETRQMADVDRNELIRLMVGRELSAVFPKEEVAPGEVVAELKNFGCTAAGLHGVDLEIRAGEIIGLAGLVGAGRTELARAIFGLDTADEGTLILNGKPVRFRAPAEAIEHGVAYLPEDRRKHGVILDFPISSNITLASLRLFTKKSGLNFQKEKETAAEFTRKLGVKTPSIFSAVSTLSGGNQQKVALSRWLVKTPRLLILDEPTQGIDVGAKSEIHTLMNGLAAQGVAILMISSELSEILGMSDRIAVMHNGRMVKILDRSEANQQNIMSLALGHYENGNEIAAA